MKVNIKGWIRVFRLPFHLALLIPFLLGAVLAMHERYAVNLEVLFLSAFALFLMTSACFIANEYFDYRTDILNRMYNKFTGGSRVLPEGGLKREQLGKAIWGSIFIAGFIGAILQFYFKTGDLTLLLGSFGMFVAYAYTAKPFQFAYRGLGEFFIGLCVGWLPVFSGYYLQTHTVSLLPTIVALPYFIACVLLIWVNEFPDYSSDKASGKNNMVVRIGKDNAAKVHTILVVLMWLCFLPVMYIKTGFSLALIAVPVIISASNLIGMHRNDWKKRDLMEKICAKTIVYTVLIPVILGIVFLV